jgi:hypothetical protein
MTRYSETNDLLFCKIDIHDALENQRRQIRKSVDAISAADFRSKCIPDIHAALVQKLCANLPVLDLENTSITEPKEVELETIRDYGRPFIRNGYSVTLSVPFSGDEAIFSVRASTFTLSPPRGSVRGQVLRNTFLSGDLSSQPLKAHFDGFIADVQKHLDWLKPDIEKFNAELPGQLSTQLADRKARLEAADSAVSGLGYKVAKR